MFRPAGRRQIQLGGHRVTHTLCKLSAMGNIRSNRLPQPEAPFAASRPAGPAMPPNAAPPADSLALSEAFVRESLTRGVMPSGPELAALARAAQTASHEQAQSVAELLGRVRRLPINELMTMRCERKVSDPLLEQLRSRADHRAAVVECGNVLSDGQLLETFGRGPARGTDPHTSSALRRSATYITQRLETGKLQELRFDEVLGLYFKVGHCLPGTSPDDFIALRRRVDGATVALKEHLGRSVWRLEQLVRERQTERPIHPSGRSLLPQTREVCSLIESPFWPQLDRVLQAITVAPATPETMPQKVFVSSLAMQVEPILRRGHEALARALNNASA